MAQPTIVVDGRGGLPDEVCRQLRLAGCGGVRGGPYAADAAEAMLGVDPGERPGVVVIIAHHFVAIEATAPWQRAGVAHLPVTCNGTASTIGPLVVPGVSSCWRCHALTTHDLDAIGGAIDGAFDHDSIPLPTGGLGVLTSAVTVATALSMAGGATSLAGVSTELELTGPTVTHRHWPRHPLCPDCSRPGAVTGPGQTQDTMAG